MSSKYFSYWMSVPPQILKLPEMLCEFQKGLPEVQLIAGVAWDCVIKDSVQQVVKKKEENSVLDLLLSNDIANLRLEGKDSDDDVDDDSDEAM